MAAIELDVLDANETFYRAFTRRDLAAMAGLWAEAHPVACVHPGWDVLDGREEVLESWGAILRSDGSPRVACSAAQAHVLGDTAFVTCHEVVEGGLLAATNLFVREGGRWRMVHHQASPIAPGQEREAPPTGLAN